MPSKAPLIDRNPAGSRRVPGRRSGLGCGQGHPVAGRMISVLNASGGGPRAPRLEPAISRTAAAARTGTASPFWASV